MEDKEFEIVDQDLGTVKAEKPSRQIRTRKTSHNNILSAYKRALIACAKRRLDLEKSRVIAGNYSGSNGEEKAEKRSKKIAQLEEKIMVLSREEVPENYVDDRAIKLKESMMESVRAGVKGLYINYYQTKKGAELFDERYGSAEDVVEQIMTEASEEIGDSTVESSTVTSDEVAEEIAEEVVVDTSAGVNIDPTNADSKEIKERVENSFERAKETVLNTEDAISAEDIKKVIDGEFVDVEDYVDSEDVRTSVDGAFEKLEGNGQTDGAVAIDDFVMPYDDAISTIFDETDPVMPYNDSISTVVDADLIPYDDSISGVYDETKPGLRIEGEVDKAVKNYFNPPNGNDLLKQEDDSDLKDVIREEVRSALEHYDSELKKTVRDPRYSYKPMTDEEIAESQRKIGNPFNVPSIAQVFVPVEKVKNASSNNVTLEDAALRDEIIVVPDRKEKVATKSKEVVEEYSFTGNEHGNDEPQFVTRNIGASDTKKLVELRARVAKLKKVRDQARETAIAEEMKLEEYDRTSRQERSAGAEKGAALERLYEEYAEALTQSINSYDNKAKFARDAVEMEERFIMAQQSRNAELDNEISVVSGYKK